MEKAALRKRLLELELEKAEREQKAQKAQKTKQPSAILAPACRFFRSGSCAKGKDCPFSHLVRGKDCRFSHVPPSVTHTSATPLCSEVLLSDFVRLYVCHTQGSNPGQQTPGRSTTHTCDRTLDRRTGRRVTQRIASQRRRRRPRVR